MLNNPWTVSITLVVLGSIVFVGSRYFSLWLRAYVTQADVSLLRLIVMSLKKVDPNAIVRAKVMMVQAGLTYVTTNAVEAHYLAGGDIHRVTLSLIAAHRSGLELDWNAAAAIDLAGRDILEAVQLSVNPKVIYCPDPESGHGDTLNGVARDGIQLKVRVRVTVRTNLTQLVGGAVEPTVIARVGEAIISAIGSCESYQDALREPNLITQQAIKAGLDSQTSFSVVSIDIADIDVGDNIGARLRLDQAEADIRIAQAFAEQRRALAIARQQEMKALIREREAAVVLAEAEIPGALAEVFRSGLLRSKRSAGQATGRLGSKPPMPKGHLVTIGQNRI